MSFMSCKHNVCFGYNASNLKTGGSNLQVAGQNLEKEFYVLNDSKIFPAMKDQLIAQF